MRNLLLGATALGLISLAGGANATQIISFGQTSQTNTITATDNGTTSTTIVTNGTGAAILIDQLFGVVTPPAIPAFLGLTATSIDAAQTAFGAIIQHYSGSFCITTAAGCGGTNELSGTFSDAAFGLNGGTQLSVNVANPPDTLTLTSSVIPAADLISPSSFTLSMSNLAALSINGTTIAPFTASFSGVANSTTLAVPEPTSLALLGIGLVGLGYAASRRKRAA